MTVEEIIKSFLDGGITLGMLALFAFVITRLPELIRTAVQTATAPMERLMQTMAENLQKNQHELERLSIIIYTQYARNHRKNLPPPSPPSPPMPPSGPQSGHSPAIDDDASSIDTTLRSVGMKVPGDDRR